MQWAVYWERRQCIAVYIRVDRRAQCDVVLTSMLLAAGCCIACARFQPKSRPLSATSPNRLHPKARTLLLLPPCRSQDPPSKHNLPRDNPSADTRDREAAGLFSLMEAISAPPVRRPYRESTYLIPFEHGVARCNGDLLLSWKLILTMPSTCGSIDMASLDTCR